MQSDAICNCPFRIALAGRRKASQLQILLCRPLLEVLVTVGHAGLYGCFHCWVADSLMEGRTLAA